MNYFNLLFPIVFCCFSLAIGNEEPNSHQTHYKLYCMYTPQFETLYKDYFLPSIKDEFEIVAREFPQDCLSSNFRSDGWEKTMLHKLDLLLEAIGENWNDQIFFYSDVDVIFLKPILETALKHLENHDFVVQQGWPRNGLCAGFFVMKGNERTQKLITTAHHLLQKQICIDDQVAIEVALDTFKKEAITWKFLPSEQFPNGRRVLKQVSGHYSTQSEIELDDAILMFHANCCIGLENKYDFLNRVQKEYSRK